MNSSLLLVLLLLHATLTASTPSFQGGWRPHTSYPARIFEATGAVFQPARNNGPHLQVFGGYLVSSDLTAVTTSYALPVRATTTVWKRRANMPFPLTHVAQVVVDQTLYTAGGFVGNAPGRSVTTCLAYNRLSNSWRTLPDLPAPRAGGGMVYVAAENALFYASGTNRPGGSFRSEDEPHSWVLRLNNLRQGWVRRADMPNPRNHLGAVSVRGRHFFLGGQKRGKEDTDNQRTLQEYVFGRDRWVERAPLPSALGHIAASVVEVPGGFLVVGGVKNGGRLCRRILFYDVGQNRWVAIGTYPRAVQSAVCGLWNRTLFCATGQGLGGADSAFSRRINF